MSETLTGTLMEERRKWGWLAGLKDFLHRTRHLSRLPTQPDDSEVPNAEEDPQNWTPNTKVSP